MVALAGTAVYCRVSSHEQKAKGDLDRQVATATRHCARARLGKPAVFTDVGSGLNATRPGLARLCKQVETGRVGTVVVSFKERLKSDAFELIVIYGRRRVGKTELVLQGLQIFLSSRVPSLSRFSKSKIASR